ncbi:ATP-dependent RNA helicase DDX1 [Tetrabaena socialis]|uniref:ATP-dependent RNA helicase DDX1 n=1 Tax=Tetrabaena socialis TaxID=47790 RepID=A0A2J7ZLS0_9CHLO|nr:ATP-dependent RNA helicase DDX1 [Tetrabaena socialis]|eukprot:PNH01214.1 ATP-dependent RNA helicase DDX1 [Tetrabaena socialis]
MFAQAHQSVRVDPREDRSWLQSQPEVFTDGCHALDRVAAAASLSREAASEGTKRLKQRLLQRLIDTLKMEQCLIFCRTNHDCDQLERFMNALGGGGGGGGSGFRGKKESGKENPYSCVVLAGARSMDERRAALAAFKEGDVRFLIATDVAARGIDIRELPYVINMTLPDKSEDYIHRVGRVGRADTLGLAISLVGAVPEKVWYCSVKGLKPWTAPDASNTRTNDKGGHTIWYDEPSLLTAIEARLSRPIPALGDDLSLPPQLAQRTVAGGEQYGQHRGGGVSKEVSEHLDAIAQNVSHLASLEWRVQSSFLRLKQRWQGAQG